MRKVRNQLTMYKVKSYYDVSLRRMVTWSTWTNDRAEVVPNYVDKFKVYRPLQQRPRDGTVVRHRTGGLKKVS